MAKKTTSEFIEEIKKINPNILILGEYINSKTQIEFICECGEHGLKPPSSLLRNPLCKKCLCKSNGKKSRTSHKDFINKMAAVNPKVEILEEYNGNHEKIKYKCECGNISYASPNQLLKGSLCRKCSAKKISIKNTYTNEFFLEKMAKINPGIEILEKYTNSKTKIKFKCSCGNIHYCTPVSLLQGHTCGKCTCKEQHDKQRKNINDFKKQMLGINENIVILGEYISNYTKIKYKCECGNISYMTPSNLLRGHKCIKCSGSEIKTQSQIEETLYKNNPFIKIIGTYLSMKDKLLCKCLICGNTWMASPQNIVYSNSGCPHCKKSKGEKRIYTYLTGNNIGFFYQYRFADCKNKRTLPFDFYVPDFNLCIEYDGEMHYIPVRYSKDKEKMKEKLLYTQKNDFIKNEYCKNKNVDLLRIPYWDINNINNVLDEKFNTLSN